MIVGPRGLSHELEQGLWWWRGWNWEQGTEIRKELSQLWPPSWVTPPGLLCIFYWLSCCLLFSSRELCFKWLFGKMALQNFIHIQLVVVVVSHWVISDSLWPYSLPGSSVHGISQERILEWIAVSFFRGSCQPRDWTYLGGGFFFFFLIIYFNWRIITSQYCHGFCHTSTWISHRCTYVPPILNAPPKFPPYPIPLGRWILYHWATWKTRIQL